MNDQLPTLTRRELDPKEIEDAKRLFEHLLSLRNDVGLLAEEYDTSLGRMAGNFPQAFSHVALINTAHNLEKQEKPAEQRSGKQTQSSRSKRKAVR